MPARAPLTELATHRVENQPPPLCDYDLFEADAALREGLHREGAGWAEAQVRGLARELGSERVMELGDLANRNPPELRIFDRYGQRIDEVRYHPAYHGLMELGISHGVPSLAWTAERGGAHVAHVALTYLFSQIEAGVVCPFTMTYAVVPAIRSQPGLPDTWLRGVLATAYDPRSLPAAEKRGLTSGMAMTEKQGGSDVRSNTTRAEAAGTGDDREYLLTGHKWFCSAPMSDFFLTLAQAPRGLSCFLVPRWLPDGSRNRMHLQRLKDKLGNRSNASSEIEYDRAHGWMLGEEGRGVRTIIEMVHHTRNDTVAAPAAFMRQALVQAIHHARHRRAFGRRLSEQPLMQAVLADLALEAEAALVLSLRVARSFDSSVDPEGRAFCRLATAVAKYWLNKRAPGHVVEALECLGGAGYVEESILPRLYREAPLNGIWEGSGNVICLDVLRAIGREPETIEALLAELETTRGTDRRLDEVVAAIGATLGRGEELEARARWLTENLAIALQASLLLRNAPTAIAEAFLATRLGADRSRAYGTLSAGIDPKPIVERALPA
jgi:putative acyl-CoA dehydrogenase